MWPHARRADHLHRDRRTFAERLQFDLADYGGGTVEDIQMPSPFPGMDPYLEEFWGDVHARLVIYACDYLQSQLPSNLRARVEERVFVDAPAEDERNVYPDIRIVERGHGPGRGGATLGEVVGEEPFVVNLMEEPITETFIEIIDVGSGRQVVTVIEVLSLANKRPGSGQDLYVKKQRELIAGKVSLVEIDLLRAGGWVLSVRPRFIPHKHHTTYRAVVRRGWEPFKAEWYAIRLQRRLPVIRVPLRETDNDVSIDLQALLERCYDNGGYQNDLNYEGEPEPPLGSEDAAWADALLREKGLRRRPATPAPRRRRKRKGS